MAIQTSFSTTLWESSFFIFFVFFFFFFFVGGVCSIANLGSSPSSRGAAALAASSRVDFRRLLRVRARVRSLVLSVRERKRERRELQSLGEKQATFWITTNFSSLFRGDMYHKERDERALDRSRGAETSKRKSYTHHTHREKNVLLSLTRT